MAQIKWTTRASQQLDKIFDYIAETNHRYSIASKLVREIHEKANQYAHQPLMGTLRPDLGEDFRSFSHKRYVIVYHPLDDGIRILSVVDGARDYGRLFE